MVLNLKVKRDVWISKNWKKFVENIMKKIKNILFFGENNDRCRKERGCEAVLL